jgi:hypothetical protein
MFCGREFRIRFSDWDISVLLTLLRREHRNVSQPLPDIIVASDSL